MPDQELVVFVTTHRPAPGEAQPHAGIPGLTKTLGELKEDWSRTVRQVAEMVQTAQAAILDGPFNLDDVTVKLAFSASGKLGFIAEAAAEAAVELKFKFVAKEPESPTP